MPPVSWLEALERTRRAAFGRLASLLGATDLNDGYWEQLETALLQADLGVSLAQEVVRDLRNEARSLGITRGEALRPVLRSSLLARLPTRPTPPPADPPRVILLVGVNGSGKTTCAARLAAHLRAQGSSVLLAAADTFRAAADEQLRIWADRLQLEMIGGDAGSDPGAVVWSAAEAAVARRIDALVVDTSGRMHTRHNLMAELEKVCRVAAKVVPGAPQEAYLVLDATTGQNGLQQAHGFAGAVPLSGVILAKLDTSARGGVGLAVAHEMHLPIRYASIGETLADFVPFDAAAYVDGLLGTP